MRRSRDELFESRISDLKEVHERELQHMVQTLNVMADQIDYLRAQLGQPNLTKLVPANPTGQLTMEEGWAPWISEEEEDVMALKDFGHLSEAESEALAERIRTEML